MAVDSKTAFDRFQRFVTLLATVTVIDITNTTGRVRGSSLKPVGTLGGT